MSKRDYYEVLGVGRDATDDELKAAYRKASIKYHPDHNPDDSEAEEKFKELNEAYGILKNPDERAAYDSMGHAAFEQYKSGGGSAGGGFSGFGGFGDLSDIFGEFFGSAFGGQAQQRNRPQKGADIRVNLDLTFEEAVFGCEKKIKVNRKESCTVCSGSGAEPGTSDEKCDRCGGSGQIRTTQQSLFGGMVQTVQSCDSCGGTGRIIKDTCKKCHGAGTETIQRQIDIKIPAGVDSDSVLPLRDQGNAGLKGGRNGDIYVYFSIKPHELFRRDGNNVYLTVPITFAQAALGDELKVPTLEGTVKLKIPEGTQSGTTFKLKNKGIASPNGFGKGSQYIVVELEVPKKLKENQKKLLREFAGISEENHQKSKSFWDKTKELFSQRDI